MILIKNYSSYNNENHYNRTEELIEVVLSLEIFLSHKFHLKTSLIKKKNDNLYNLGWLAMFLILYL